MEGHWSHRAVTDLLGKVKSKPVRKYLVEVSQSSLHRHYPEWGGALPNGRLWRRGITEADEFLDAEELEPHQALARGYILVYLLRRSEKYYEITGLLTDGELGAGLALTSGITL
jgi:hypothetical protein